MTRIPEAPDRQGELRERPRVAARSTGWWGTVMAIIVFSSMLATMIFANLYLRPRADSWPPEGIVQPGLLWPSIATAAAVISLVPVILAHRAVRTHAGPVVQLWSLLGAVAGAVFVGAGIWDLATVDLFINIHVFGSLYFVTSTLQLVLAVMGVGFLGALPLHIWGRELTPRVEGMTVNVALWWYYIVGGWLCVYAVLHLFPRLW